MQGCQTIPSRPRVEVPTLLAEPCNRPEGKESVKTVGELAAYSAEQDASLRVCEAKRSALVTIIGALNGPAKRHWWGR